MQTSTQLGTNVGGPSSPAFSLGMASTFNVQTSCVPGSGTNCSVGQGSIQFAAGNDLAMWLAQCGARNCLINKLTIANASPQGTVVYDLRDATVTGTTSGTTALTASLHYRQVGWTFSSGNGQAPTYGCMAFGADAGAC
jgi:hypothetical protein